MLEGWPGEKLLTKLVETLEKGIGAYGKPWQIKREEAARTEARRNDLLILAHAGKDAEEIRAGRMGIDENGQLIALPAPTDSPKLPAPDDNAPIGFVTVPSQDATGTQELFQAHQRDTVAREFERSINLRKIGVYAQDEAEEMKADPVSEEPIDPDWFARWRNNAQDVSREEMQRLWARLLAGEVRQPGSYSAHTMDFLARMSKNDADLLARLASLKTVKYIFSKAEKCLAALGIGFEEILYLSDIGILNGVTGAGGIAWNLTPLPFEGKQAIVIPYGPFALVFMSDSNTNTVKVPVYSVSVVGQEILNLAYFSECIEYVDEFVAYFKDNGFTDAKIGNWIPDPKCPDGYKGTAVNMVEWELFRQKRHKNP